MALKEIKTRIASVNSTKKITEARQRISSAQLRRSQADLQRALDYQAQVEHIAAGLYDRKKPVASALTNVYHEGKTAVVVLASNSGMCGAFNAKMIKETERIKQQYAGERLEFIPVGKKLANLLPLPDGLSGHEHDGLLHKIEPAAVSEFARMLAARYATGAYKQINIIYYHFKSTAVQKITEQQLLPYTFPEQPATAEEYILEPSREELLEAILPLALYANLYAALLDHKAAEHGARTVAMQLATENADKLLGDLRLTYNKVRQQNITSELLDMVGGSFA